MPSGIPYVVDYDDAVFHNYDLSQNRLVRIFLGSKIDRVMENSAIVICGNNYLSERAQLAGASQVECVPTVVDASRYPITKSQANKIPVIGWIGSPSTQCYVLKLKPILEKLCLNNHVRVVLVGATASFVEQWGNLPVEILPWTEDTEVQAISGFDIGIMPLPDGPWERGKCGFKLVQYMACGKPVVASPVGVNVDIVNVWRCGILAGDLSDWHTALQTLLNDSDLRKSLGGSGRQAVEKHYSLQAQSPRLVKILRNAVQS
ncbi:hypothetical protein GCM10007160_37810 [Litchfieldella qijiaojingensis]|uniref:Glycosyltransferase n=2 Tax=Litchfieldella qijiaojingensis TaxID=980347 RepID=A0ABQ2Z8D3_9GAMM|nr:hypothetical protein GCM10007160_37810 [Halomonas qijiaojingensis]